MQDSVQNWNAVDGDNTYAINWPLNENSLVIEVGAYKGRWSKQLHDKYNCKMICFEPQEWCVVDYLYPQFLGIRSRNKVAIIPCALGDTSGRFPMGEFETDACSFLHVGERAQGEGCMLEAVNAFELYIQPYAQQVDLMMINIEGYEYTLLDHMFKSGLMHGVDRFAVQWHTFADPTAEKYVAIHQMIMDAGFHQVWSFFPTLTAYSRFVSEVEVK